MHVSDLLHNRRAPTLSFEFFPPKDEQGMKTLEDSARKLLEARPDFVTVTYGAGGSTRQKTLEVCEMLRRMGFAVVMPHLTCVGHSRAELDALADDIRGRGFRNIMALRGDPPEGQHEFRTVADGLAHASDLVELIRKRHPDICCGVAGYPEKHPEAASLDQDIAHLRAKLDAGGGFVTTQLFFENRFYFDFVKRCRAAGIAHPILPGLMPATSAKQIRRFVSTCGATVPPDLESALVEAADDPARGIAVGIEWLARQIDDLLGNGAPGIHLYVLNRARVALAPAVAECFGKYRGNG